jgi:hypothetical protein
VARPAVGFDELKERLKARMEWLGIKVTAGCVLNACTSPKKLPNSVYVLPGSDSCMQWTSLRTQLLRP